MKLFVTGGTGFVGSYFLHYALTAGHTILATHRPTADVTKAPRLEWLECELDALLPAVMVGCDALIHFAAVGVSPKPASREEMSYWNVSVPLQLMETAKAAGVQRVVVAGSFAEYGRSADLYDLITPDAPLLPTSSYAASKAANFTTSHAAAIELGLELCYLRVFSAYGIGQSEVNFWPALRVAALAGRDFPMTRGEQVRDFVPIEDVAREFLYAATRTDINAGIPRVWNVGSGIPVSIREFALYWWNTWQAKGKLQIGALPYRPNECMRFVPEITDRAPLTDGVF